MPNFESRRPIENSKKESEVDEFDNSLKKLDNKNENEKQDFNKEIKDFLLRNNIEDLRIAESSGGLEGALEKLKNEGGIKNIYQNGEIISSLGFLVQEKALYVYYLVIDKKYRKNPKIVKRILSNIYELAKSNDKKDIVFKALASADYNNQLYNKLAYSKEESFNDAGIKRYKYHLETEILSKYKKIIKSNL